MNYDSGRNGIRGVLFAILILSVSASFAVAQGTKKETLKRYTAKYHLLYTDLSTEDVLESMARINSMAEVYYDRTKGFAGAIRRKLPFYLYANRTDYVMAVVKLAGPGFADSAGVYTGDGLRATADTKVFEKDTIWHIIQHEGFHQFVHMVIEGRKRRIPIWLNEGLAEYFGEAIWTGDSMVTGVIDAGKTITRDDGIWLRQGRLQSVQARLKAGQFRQWDVIIPMNHEQWNMEMDATNYDQVWSMVQFFVHAKNGKYRKAFSNYINDVASGRPSIPSFKKQFAGNIREIQQEYIDWWLSLKGNPTADLYDQAMLETLMSFLARAKMDGQKFETADAFFLAAREGKLNPDIKKKPYLWLPPSLLKDALEKAKKHKTWAITKQPGNRLGLKLTREDGTVLEGTYELKGSKPKPVIKVTLTPPIPTTAPAEKTKDAKTTEKKP